MLIDTHAHLNLGEFDKDLPEVVTSALESDIRGVITPGVTPESCLSSFDLISAYPEFFYSALGIHPTEAKQWTPEFVAWLKKHTSHPRVVAIGETGLDYYWDTSQIHLQKEVFRQHIRLAKEESLPLIIHLRDKKNQWQAYEDALDILQEEDAAAVGGVLHCFSGTYAHAQRAIDYNFRLGLGGVLTFKNAPDLQETAKKIPLKHLLLETDSPWLSPHPFRGNRNTPQRVKLVADKLAQLRDIPFEKVAQETTFNARQLFKLDIAENK